MSVAGSSGIIPGMPVLPFGHRRCTLIMPGSPTAHETLSKVDPKLYPPDRTHGCWCSFWKLLGERDIRVWRKGRWLRPKPREVMWRPALVPPG